MRLHIFARTDLPYAANWALTRTAPEDDYQLKRNIENNFYMDNFLFSVNCKLK